jgi:nucleotidyltransferase/DNA polymerase involved in DNA repair
MKSQYKSHKLKRKSSDLQIIPGIGKSIEKNLNDIGIFSITDLCNKDAEKLFDMSNRKVNKIQDRCLLYVFRCAVYFANTKNPETEKLKWWNWKDK